MSEVTSQLEAETVGPRRLRMTGVAARITAINILGASTGFITGPLLARALGPSGRGDLAAIVVPFTLAAPLLGLGISSFAYRTLPRGRSIGSVIGSLGVPLLLLGGIGVALAVPVADLLATGRPTVREFLIIGLCSMPLVLLTSLLLSSLQALERWRPVMIMRLIPFAVTCLAVVGLFLSHDLTVSTAAAATIAGALIAIVPGLPLLWSGRPRFHKDLARGGLRFGVKSWIGGLAQMGNTRLDQLLMITVVTPHELGLYAVAVTISGASGLAAGGLAPPLMARVGAGESHLTSHAVRIMIAATVCIDVALAIVSPILLGVVFGAQFQGAETMLLILLVAQVPLAGAEVLSAALQADGAPLIPTIGEGIALVVTVVGLVVLLGPLGGVGAAIVSLAAYGSSFLYQLVMAHRCSGTAIHEFLIPTRADLGWAVRRLGTLASPVRIGAVSR